MLALEARTKYDTFAAIVAYRSVLLQFLRIRFGFVSRNTCETYVLQYTVHL